VLLSKLNLNAAQAVQLLCAVSTRLQLASDQGVGQVDGPLLARCRQVAESRLKSFTTLVKVYLHKFRILFV
jgi:hypothetical protein